MGNYRADSNGGLYSNNHFTTPVGRFAWLYLTSPKPSNFKKSDGSEGDAKYEATIAFPKDVPQSATLQSALGSEVAQMIGEFNSGKTKSKLGECELLQDGDAAEDLDKYPWKKGCWVIVARSKFAPPIIDKTGSKYSANDLAGGMKGKIAFKARVGQTGVSYTLEGIQFWEDDGERYGGGAKSPSQLFDACEPEEVSPKTAVPESPPAAEVTPVAVKAQKGKSAIVNML